ncbi:hypothetical protein Dpoa2040_000892 [Dickeya sp. CFBP 2040]|uniref:hypothetical protein n=1 Tax=Dickeya sp. CFBP 2040 TaxID=2718531 RepID=UPI001446FC91|nr:hypothetical protein [Dickeya sp. CFBP 2040]
MDYCILRSIFSGLPDLNDPRFVVFNDFYLNNKVKVLSSLPWVVSEIIENDGFDKMIEFIISHGGCRIYISRNYPLFVQRVGMRLSEKTHEKMLFHSMPDNALDIPSSWGIYLKLRHIAVTSLLSQGVSQERIARDFGITSRALRKIMAVK